MHDVVTYIVDYLSVSENANETPNEEIDHVNSPMQLSQEATRINENFSQQCLSRGAVRKFAEKNPFVEEDEEPASVAYRYRKFVVSPSLTLVARTQFDAVSDVAGKDDFVTIRALNEWDGKALGNVVWREKLDAQRGAVIASELKNNNCKLAKWTTSALLAGSSSLRLGFVSRVHPNDNQSHVVLGTQSHKPKEFASQINLNMSNCWGILKYDLCIFFQLLSLCSLRSCLLPSSRPDLV